MNAQSNPAVKMIPLQMVLILCVFVFLGGVVAGIFFCARMGHDDLVPTSGNAQQGEFAGRIESLKKELAENPGIAESWTQLGNLYFDTDHYQKAIEAYQRSLAIEPNNPDVWTDLGTMYRSNGEARKAIEAFDKAMEVDPMHANARFNKGVVLLHDLKDTESALKEWEALNRIHPSYECEGQPLDEIILHYRLNAAAQNMDGRKD